MQDLKYIFIKDLDKKDVINEIYTYFRNKNIEYLYNHLLKYDTKIVKEDLIPELSDEELNILITKNKINNIHGINLNIYFDKEYLIYNPKLSRDYIIAIFNLKLKNKLLNDKVYDKDFLDLEYCNVEIERYTKLININNKKVDELRSRDNNEKVIEKLKKNKWLLEEEKLKYTYQKELIMNDILNLEEKLYRGKGRKM